MTRQVGVLGPLTIHVAGQEVRLPAAKQRCLLGLLALTAGEVVGRDEIIDVLWPRKTPRSCSELVTGYVSRLRRAGMMIDLVGTGYRLVADTDLRAFETLAAQDSLAEALACWRGPVLADLPDELRDHPRAIAAAQRRLEVVLEFADRAIQAGRHADAVARLRQLDEPLHEGLHAKLGLALAGSGEQAAALRLFTDIRRRLADELGIEPSAELRAAHHQVLRQDIPRPAARPAQLTADITGFTGRAEYLSQLDDLSTAPAVVIAGMPGVGKTALAVHWGHRVRDQFPDGQLQADLRGQNVLGRFLRMLGVPPRGVPADPDEAAALYRTLLSGKRMLILLDNATGASQIRPLLPGTPGSLVLITSRNRMDGLVARDGARHLILTTLPVAEAHELLANLGVPNDGIAELAELCAHLPLALRITAADLAAHPQRPLEEHIALLRNGNRLAALEVHGDEQSAVRAAFATSYQALDRQAAELFRLLAWIPGPDFGVDVASYLLGAPAERLLDTLATAHLVQPTTHGRYTYHDLLRLYGRELGPSPIDRFHDWCLGNLRSATDLLYAAEFPAVTGHPGTPVPFTGPHDALAWLDAERATLVATITEAPDVLAWQMAALLRGYFSIHPHVIDWEIIATRALRAAQATRDIRGEIVSLNSLAELRMRQCRPAEALTHAARALAMSRDIDWDVGETTALTQLAFGHAAVGDFDDASAHANALAGRNEVGRMLGMMVLGLVASWRGDLPTAIDCYSTTLRLSETFGEANCAVASLAALADIHRELGDIEQARRLLAEAERFSDVPLKRPVQSNLLCAHAQLHSELGEHDTALSYAHSAITVAATLGDPSFESGTLETLGSVCHRRGDHREAIRHYFRALDLAVRGGQKHTEARVHLGLAAALTSLNDDVQAASHVERATRIARAAGFENLPARR
ncbi:BTAD domain-containing putative transcriptional regulator [Kibdelosporangium persicum]|uniref:DNA-binding transcriptional activator of the SARP family n=1 Tax=Kibdelosporangium persicum TaxID=2698649 RepID=A0ABX2F261_9PSEU|nr:BTAD domain-containing putative transcriptional regulator [Kibdelosporangium persicum]NRN65012.1 DNA-binding transcriptional activator of the SARP family [Kibdelosporangium persicum]